ncbi:hypothetical protein T439DRAFT_382982 [Meredithblackwellia eburnea MCA 4105]
MCAYTAVDRRRRRHRESESTAPVDLPIQPISATSSFEPQTTLPIFPSSLSNPDPLPLHQFTRHPTPPSRTDDPTSSNTSEYAADLTLLANAMAHERPSPAGGVEGAGGGPSTDPAGGVAGGGGGGDDAESVTSTAARHQSFVQRLHEHLTVTFALRSFPRGKGGGAGMESAEDEMGGGNLGMEVAFLPERAEAREFVRCYFEQASATYRYLEVSTVDLLLTKFYDREPSVINDSDSVCLILLVLAVGCLWSPSWSNADPQQRTPQAVNLFLAAKQKLSKLSFFPVRLITVQTHLLMVQLHLGLAQFQSAWLAFGQAARLAQLMGLHRAPEAHLRGTTTDELRKRTFWSAFTMDRYLSVVVGFPVLFDERDITQTYFSVPPMGRGKDGDQTLTGSLAHIKLSRIMGHAIRLLGRRDLSSEERDENVRIVESEIHIWEEETPAFFCPKKTGSTTRSDVDGFTLVLEFFQRQQRVVHSAYHFLHLFTYRAYLLSSFLNHLPGSIPLPSNSTEKEQQPSEKVRECVKAATEIARMSNVIADKARESGRQRGFGGTFWNTSYFTFASLTVLCVYTMVYPLALDREKIESIIEGAMRGHELLDGGREGERGDIVKESRKIGRVLRRRPGPDSVVAGGGGGIAGLFPQPTTSLALLDPHHPSSFVPASSSGIGGEGTTSVGIFSNEEGIHGGNSFDTSTLSNWDWMWMDMQGLVQVGLDPTSQDFGTSFDIDDAVAGGATSSFAHTTMGESNNTCSSSSFGFGPGGRGDGPSSSGFFI